MKDSFHWITLSQAAEQLGLPVKTLYAKIGAGNTPFPYYKFDRRYRVRQDDLDAYIEAMRVEPVHGFDRPRVSN
ncbi:helix-turn-helix domain-containing protein [Magnetovibrio sp. PR-2]|uniref:helix-turn-helix domain-containing protein n=1 Tax=Magnetovibrio sp. PR-2 TaxID=3120356 RepID=UPI003FA5FD3F